MTRSILCRTTWLIGLAVFGLAMLRHPWSVMAQSPTGDSLSVVNRTTLAIETVECERIPLGEPDDYKPCVAQLPDGELLL